ncbi:hypothetical protein BGX29_002936, partial [Mortierella sp. GBA35]
MTSPGGSSDNGSDTTTQVLLYANLLSSDPADVSFATEDPSPSPTKLYSWNFLEGNGRIDSSVDDPWIWSDVNVGHDLMDFRRRVIENNGGLTDPHEKLTLTQEDTRNADSDRLVPDFTTVTMANKRQLSLLLMEGKVESNRCFQIWDDKTKLGQEMKLAMDCILMLQPEDDIWVVGILVREPLVEFYTMHMYAEATYVMRRFAACYAVAGCMNMFSIGHMMEAFQHAQSKVRKTVAAIRRVKIRPSSHPK